MTIHTVEKEASSAVPLDDDDFSDVLSLLDEDEGPEVDAPNEDEARLFSEESEEVPVDGGGAVQDSREAGATSDQNIAYEGHDTSDRKLDSVLDLSARLASLTEANERRRAEEEQRRQQAELEAERQRQEELRNKPLYTEEDLDLSPEEMETYRDSIPVVEKVARRVAQKMYEQSVRPLQDELNRVQTQTQSLGQETAQTRVNAFVSSVRGAVPDLDQRVKTPEWKEYMAGSIVVPGAGRMTRAKAVQLAAQHSDLEYVVDLVRGFKPAEAEAHEAARSPGAGQSSATGTRRVAKPSDKKIRYSVAMRELEGMSQKVRAGRMALDKYDRAVAEFEAALEAGRVDMDA